MSVKDKIVIVTGGGAGIGLAIVHAFLEQGARVAVVDISNLDQFEGTKDVLPVKCNVTSDGDVNKAVDATIAKWGRIDILVNNAGVMDDFGRTDATSGDTWRKCFSVNVDGPFFFIRRCVRVFLSQKTKGNIINVCSTAAFRGSAAGAAYTASKHALLGLSRSTAWGYAKDGIICNVVAPGGVGGTNIMDKAGFDAVGYDVLEPFHKMNPAGCTPEDVAGAVLYLAGNKAINGAEVAVDHGLLTA